MLMSSGDEGKRKEAKWEEKQKENGKEKKMANNQRGLATFLVPIVLIFDSFSILSFLPLPCLSGICKFICLHCSLS